MNLNYRMMSNYNLLKLHFGDNKSGFGVNSPGIKLPGSNNFGINSNFGMMSSSNMMGIIYPNPSVDQFKSTNISFHQPDWNDVMSKTDPAMSEDEFIEAIRAQAKSDFENGYRRGGSAASGDLMRQYIQVVSPDRKGLYDANMAKTGGKLNETHAIWDDGERVMTFNTMMNKWMFNGTSKEMDRMQQYYEIYNDAYFEAVDAHDGPIDSTKYRSDAYTKMPTGAGYSGRA